jgi:hypothetical protein
LPADPADPVLFKGAPAAGYTGVFSEAFSRYLLILPFFTLL